MAVTVLQYQRNLREVGVVNTAIGSALLAEHALRGLMIVLAVSCIASGWSSGRKCL